MKNAVNKKNYNILFTAYSRVNISYLKRIEGENSMKKSYKNKIH
jgi:hypothetical protein